MQGTPVEVRKNQQNTTWYDAVLLDIQGESVRVGFQDDIWPPKAVPSHCVRRCPLEIEDDDFDPQVDEHVEVFSAATDSSPKGWSLGKVKMIKTSFYFIGFGGAVGSQRGRQDLIVERGALRRVNDQPPLDIGSLSRREIAVDPMLHTWISSQDSLGCLSQVRERSQLLVASCTSSGSNGDEPQVLIIGDEHAVDLAEKLLTLIHFKNQIEIQRFHEQRESFMERLQEWEQWSKAQHREVFTVEQGLVGKIIGKSGQNIKTLREKYGVEIHLQDKEGGRKPTVVTVTGDDDESVKQAREELEYVIVKIPVEPEQVGWILGKGFANLHDIAKKADLHTARYDDETQSLELCGLRQQVEDAKMLISVHCEYLPVYQDMDEEQSAIQQSFEQLDASGGGKGRGKKGKDKDGPGKGRDGKKGDREDAGDRGKGRDGKKGDREDAGDRGEKGGAKEKGGKGKKGKEKEGKAAYGEGPEEDRPPTREGGKGKKGKNAESGKATSGDGHAAGEEDRPPAREGKGKKGGKSGESSGKTWRSANKGK